METIPLLPTDVRWQHFPPPDQPSTLGGYRADPIVAWRVQFPILLSNNVHLHFQSHCRKWGIHDAAYGAVRDQKALHLPPTSNLDSPLLGSNQHRRLARNNSTFHEAILLGENRAWAVASSREVIDMKMRDELLQDLRTADATEEKLPQVISRVLDALFEQTELPDEKIGKLRVMLDRLTQETDGHAQQLKKMIEEVEAIGN